jgi:hypothetical protein
MRVVNNHHIDLLSSRRHCGYAGNAVRVLATPAVRVLATPGLHPIRCNLVLIGRADKRTGSTPKANAAVQYPAYDLYLHPHRHARSGGCPGMAVETEGADPKTTMRASSSEVKPWRKTRASD